jgi:AcrR family transcriptional regulator
MASPTGRPAARPRRKPASQYHHGDLRRALLQEAVRTIATEGIERLTLREAGRRLGVSRSALYRHFADKSALLAAVAREGFQTFADDLQAAWAAAEGSWNGLEQMGRAYVRFALAHPSHYRVMFGDFRELSEKDPELHAVAALSFDVLVHALTTLQASGAVRQDEVQLQAQYVWAIVHGVAMLAIDGQLMQPDGDPLDALLDLTFERMRSGLGGAKQ